MTENSFDFDGNFDFDEAADSGDSEDSGNSDSSADFLDVDSDLLFAHQPVDVVHNYVVEGSVGTPQLSGLRRNGYRASPVVSCLLKHQGVPLALL